MSTSPSVIALAAAGLTGAVLAGTCTRRPVENLSMQQAVATFSSDVAVAPFERLGSREYLVVAAVGPTRTLAAQRFSYRGEGVPQLEASERMEWTAQVPAGARVVVAASGRGIDELLLAWAGWTDATGLHMLHANAEGAPPTTVAVPGGDLLVLPPVIVASGHLQAFVFHDQAGSLSLARHDLTSIPGAGATVATTMIMPVQVMPRLAAAAAVPHVRSRDVAIVGWVESGPRWCKVGVAVVGGAAAVATPATFDIAGVRPVGGRLAVQMTPMFATLDDTGRPPGVQVAFVGEQVERGGYVVVRADLDVKTGAFHLATTPLGLPADPPLHSAYVWLARDPNDDRQRVYALRDDGTLLLVTAGAGRFKRAGVPLDYAFPIEPDGREPQLTSAGEMKLAPMPWDD